MRVVIMVVMFVILMDIYMVGRNASNLNIIIIGVDDDDDDESESQRLRATTTDCEENDFNRNMVVVSICDGKKL